MAKLAELGVKLAIAQALFTGVFEQSAIENGDGEPYFVGKLKNPITARSSMDSTVTMEVEELYLTKATVESDKWEGTPEDGVFIPDFKVDVSKTHLVGLYQAESIKAWSRGRNKERREGQNTELKEKLEAIRSARASQAKPNLV